MFCPKCRSHLTTNIYAIQNNFRLTGKSANVAPINSSTTSKLHSLPEKYRARLIEAQEDGSRILRSRGLVPEPLETALWVEEHRWYWKPKDIKFIIVAESHVYTNANEVSVKIIPDLLPEDVPKDVPLNFVKLVYCLGYGEPSILDRPEIIENNAGTRQYMNLFRDCIGFVDNTASFLQWKARLLKTLRDKGIWLLDASCHACAKGRGERLPPEIVERIVPISWNIYVKTIIDDLSIDPKYVWIIGKGLHDSLKGKYARGSNWIYQPNAHFTNPEKYEEKRHRQTELEKEIKLRCDIHDDE
jgi:hypothetical protein